MLCSLTIPNKQEPLFSEYSRLNGISAKLTSRFSEHEEPPAPTHPRPPAGVLGPGPIKEFERAALS